MDEPEKQPSYPIVRIMLYLMILVAVLYGFYKMYDTAPSGKYQFV